LLSLLTSKNLDGKRKRILFGIAGATVLDAGISDFDFNPLSAKEYTNQRKVKN